MKKFWSIFAAVLICLGVAASLFAAYHILWGDEQTAVSAETAPPDALFRVPSSPYYTPAATKHGYNALTTEDQQDVYRAIVRRITSITNEPTGDKYTNSSGYFMARIFAPRLSPRELAMVISCVREDFPEAFWLTGNCRHGTDENGQYFIQLISFLSPTELDSSIQTFNAAIADMMASLPDRLSEFDRELYIHDWLLENCQYEDKGYDPDKNDLYTGSAYGAFVGGETICEGYARGFQLLLKLAGIESVLVTGSSVLPLGGGGRAHIWNVVRIDGQWYQTDVTWNDSPGAKNAQDYLNLTTEQMAADHNFDPLFDEAAARSPDAQEYDASYNRPYPDCTSTEMNYYVQRGVSVRDKSQATMDRLTLALVKAYRENLPAVPVIFSAPETAVDCREWVTQHAFFRSARDANLALGEKVYLENEVYYIRSGTLGNVLIFKTPLREEPDEG